MQKSLSQILPVFRLALPIMGSAITSLMINLVGMLMVARLGHAPLAAGALATSTYITLIVFCLSTLYAVGILVSRARVDSTPREVGQLVHHGFFVALLLGLPVMFIVWHLDLLLTLFNQPPELVRLAGEYFRFITFGIPAILWIVVIQQFFIGTERPRFNLQLILIASPFTIALSYLFIFGKHGFPALGLAGIAMALTVSSWVQLLVLMIYLSWHRYHREYRLFYIFDAFALNTCLHILKIGLPIGLQYGFELAAFATMTYFMGWLGESTLAAQQIVMQINTIVVMITIGISQAVAVLVGRAASLDDCETVDCITRSGIVLGSVIMSAVTVIFLTVPERIVSIYLNINDPINKPVIHIAIILFAIAGFVQIADAVRNIISGALRGLQDSVTPMRLGIAFIWLVGIPLGYLLCFPADYGVIGLRTGILVSFILCTAVLIQRFRKIEFRTLSH